jgi:hypothetical protein
MNVNSIYDDAVTFGRAVTLIMAVFATILGIIMIVIAFVGEKEGKVILINGEPSGTCSDTCKITLQYKQGGEVKVQDVDYKGGIIHVGDVIKVYLLGDKVLNVNKTALIITGLIIILGGWIVHYLSSKFRFFAAGEAVSTVFDLARPIV